VSRFDTLPSAAALVVDHPSFGPLRASGRFGEGRWRWDALELIGTLHGQADFSFEAGSDGPGSAHEAQLASLIDQLDRLTAAAAPVIKSALADCHDLPVADPWAGLEWEGAHLTGKEGRFEIHYACKGSPDAMIKVHFERSEPILVQLDD
jgi:hypothetical protein